MATQLQLNHIARAAADVRRLAAFYEEALGFERVPSPTPPGFQLAWLRLPGNLGVTLHIIERDPTAAAAAAVVPPAAQLGRRDHLAFSVADYDAFVAGLRARGVDVFEVARHGGRRRQVVFSDPEGNVLEVSNLSTEP